MTDTAVVKPHHLLDIIKLYGAGLTYFTPDFNYGHDFYLVGNWVLSNPTAIVRFTTEGDDICQPCRFFKKGHCTDLVDNNPAEFRSKDFWNKTIDNRLMKVMSIKNGDQMSILEYCELSVNKLNPKTISEVWRERPQNETNKRIELLTKGLRLYLLNFG